jgi:nitrite reductase/ring-hydroxylating ferredoxin subunit
MNDDADEKGCVNGEYRGSIRDAVNEVWQRVAGKGEPGEGRTLDAQLGSSARILLTRSRGRVYGTQTECGHMRFPLGVGKIEGSVITCPLHKAQFDLSTGAVARKPRNPWILRATKVGKQMGLISCNPLHTYEVEERPEGIYARRRLSVPE